MRASEGVEHRSGSALRSVPAGVAGARRVGLFGGATAGNEQLTSMTGTILLVLLAALGITILRIGQLIWLHLFVGVLLLGPVAVKLASTGYKFMRYYSRSEAYVSQGPPELLLRALGPFVVVSTVVVFASGIVLLELGPADRGLWVGVHKASFILWLGFTGLHVLGHLLELPVSLRAGLSSRSPGFAGRWIAIGGALAAGLVIAIALIPQFASWAVYFPHHHH